MQYSESGLYMPLSTHDNLDLQGKLIDGADSMIITDQIMHSHTCTRYKHHLFGVHMNKGALVEKKTLTKFCIVAQNCVHLRVSTNF